jgi:hypothetical protein
MTRRSPIFVVLLLLAASGCAIGGTGSDGGGGAGGKGDGPGAETTLARCWIEAGTGADVLTCADDVSSGAKVQRIEVGLADGGSATIDLSAEGEGEVSIERSAYPLTLDLMAQIDVVEGADAHEFWMTQTVQQPEELEVARAFFAPYDLWTIVVENQTEEGDVGFDGHSLFLEGADVPRSDDGTLAVPATNVILDAGEVHTFVLPVTKGTHLIHGTARDLSVTDVLTPFSLEKPGRYVLTAEGLFESTGPAPDARPIEDGSDALRCGPYDVDGGTHLTCFVVSRPGVEIADATVTVGGEMIPIAVDGTVMDLGPLTGETQIHAALQLASGIEGLGRDLPPVEGAFVVDEDTEAALTFPFDLVHVEVTVESDVRAAMFDGPNPHVVTLSRRWGGMTETQYQLRVRLGAPGDRHVWIAVSAGADHVGGDIAVFETEIPERYPTVLVDGERWLVTRGGPVPE